MKGRTRCPRCRGPVVVRRNGLFRWKACRRPKSCGWSVFTDGDDPRDHKATA